MGWTRSKWVKRILFLGVSLLVLPIWMIAIRQAVRLFPRAVGVKANLVINSRITIGKIDQFWRGVSQGAESQGGVFTGVEDKLNGLKPRWVRIDHIFDSYQVLKGEEGGWIYDFSLLDKTVKVILDSGAVPVFSLSYMPPEIAEKGGVLDKPKDWGEWEAMVEALAKHYSRDMGLVGVYYEVWNEPDLFGGWRTRGEKNYLELYGYTARAIRRALGSRGGYYVGGPATTGMYPEWMERLAEFTDLNGLPLDFVSWHRYDQEVGRLRDDVEWVNQWKEERGESSLQVLISEWGWASEQLPGNDNQLSASHMVAAVEGLIGEGVEGMTAFELVDGKSPDGSQYWGRWGMVTHPDTGGGEKLRYRAFELLNQMDGDWLLVQGEGTWVKAVSAVSEKEGEQIIKILMVNYDTGGSHWEQTPVRLINLDPGKYSWSRVGLLSGGVVDEEYAEEGEVAREVVMQPNDVVLVTVRQVTGAGERVMGVFGAGRDLHLATGVPLEEKIPQGITSGTIEFWIQPGWDGGDSAQRELVSLPVGGGRRLAIKTENGELTWGGWLVDEELWLARAGVESWRGGEWHHLAVDWEEGRRLSLWIDGKLVGRYEGDIISGLASPVEWPLSDINIDELRITDGVRYTTEFNPEEKAVRDEMTVVAESF